MIGSTICRTANAAMPYPISARKTRLRLNSPNSDSGFTTLTPGLSLAHGPPQDAKPRGLRRGRNRVQRKGGAREAARAARRRESAPEEDSRGPESGPAGYEAVIRRKW